MSRIGRQYLVLFFIMFVSCVTCLHAQISSDNSRSDLNGISKIVLLGDSSFLNQNIEGGGALHVIGIDDFPDPPSLENTIRSSIGRPIDMEELGKIRKSIIRHFEKNGRPVVNVSIPKQAVHGGIIKLILNEGTLSDIQVVGNEHFSSDEILSLLNIRSSRNIDPEKVGRAIDHANKNPFLNLSSNLEPGENRGDTNLVVNVKDRRPVRVFAGVDNYGSKLTGEERAFGGINFGKVFGPSRLLNYQYAGDWNFDLLFSHSVSYMELLPWQHVLTVYGGYSDAKSIFDDATLGQEGTSFSVGMQYSIPLPVIFDDYKHSVKVGADFKQSDSALFYNQIDIANTLNDVVQLMLAYEGVLTDSWGATSVSLNAFFSPGRWTHHSNEDDYFTAGYGNPEYVYGRIDLVRTTKLPLDGSMLTRLSAQRASTNLPSSEQMGAGGNASVRGYDEREANGDYGIFISNEIRTASYPVSSMIPGVKDAGNIQLLGFVDYANVCKKSPSIDDDNPNVDMLSVGLGFRYALNDCAVLNFDYGWQLKDSNVDILTRDPRNSRGHVYFNLSY